MKLKHIKSFLANFIIPQKRNNIKAWKKILGFYPYDLEIYRVAATHVSCQKKDRSGKIISNERLEYLGDAFISAVIAELLYHKYPNLPEGTLTRTRAKIVCRSHLNDVCIQTGFNKLLRTSHGLKDNAKNVYGNAVEALVGAIYIDQGFKTARSWIIDNIASHGNIEDLNYIICDETDFKSHLYEWAQEKHKTIRFEIINHAYNATTDQHSFTCRLFINDQPFATGVGHNKRYAEQNTAKNALEMLNITK